MISRNCLIFLCLLAAGCTAPTSRPVRTILPDDLKDQALIYGSIWDPRPERRYGDVLLAESADGHRIRIAGDAATPARSGEGSGTITLFSQLLEPGEYRFNRSGNARVKSWGQTESFAAGQIVYMGQMVCVDTWSGCMWFSFDQLGRDIYYASEAAPDLPWHHTRFRESDFSASMFDFQRQRVELNAPGRAVHRASGASFPVESSGFRRVALETQGSLTGGALYRDDRNGMDAEVLVYPMNLFADRRAETGLSTRLREVVLDREASIAIASYFMNQAEDEGEHYMVNAGLVVRLGSYPVQAGRQIDATGTGAEAGIRVRYCIFSENGWLIRFRFTWREENADATLPVSDKAEQAIREFIEQQAWPNRERGGT